MTTLQKIVTFTCYENEDVQALTSEEFFATEANDSDWNEWVWHKAPSKEAAIARHQEAFDFYEGEVGAGRDFDWFVHEEVSA